MGTGTDDSHVALDGSGYVDDVLDGDGLHAELVRDELNEVTLALTPVDGWSGRKPSVD